LVVGAIVLSFTADERRDAVDEPPFDTEVFCSTAVRFSEFRRLDLDAGSGSQELQSLQLVAGQLATISPEPVAEDLQDVGQALQNVDGVVRALPPDDPDAIGVVSQSLDQELAAVSEQAERVAAYIDRWCGPLPAPDSVSPVPTEPG
jgi:hypothetical protein